MSSDRFQNLQNNFFFSSVTYPAIWRCERISRGRCGVSCGRCGCECGGCASLKEMIHLQWETTAPPEGDAASPAEDAVSPSGDLLASPNFGICDTTLFLQFTTSLNSLRPSISQLRSKQKRNGVTELCGQAVEHCQISENSLVLHIASETF
jgi:hypothetical protein